MDALLRVGLARKSLRVCTECLFLAHMCQVIYPRLATTHTAFLPSGTLDWENKCPTGPARLRRVRVWAGQTFLQA